MFGITNQAAGFRKGRMFPMQFSFSKASVKGIDIFTGTFAEYKNESDELLQTGSSESTLTQPQQVNNGLGETIQIGANNTLTTTITMKWNDDSKG
jgi:hypothetical protein